MDRMDDKIPLYSQLTKEIEHKVDNGVWKTGSKIPSERELSVIYNVSRITVRNAINELVLKGKLEKIQGKGTYVLRKSIVQNLGNVYSFSKEMERQGKISITKLINRKIIKADYKIAERLGINIDDYVIYLERLRCTEEEVPIIIEKTYFALEKYKFILDMDIENKSLYKTLEIENGIVIDKAIETFKACELTTSESKQLSCKKKKYGLLIKRTSYSNEKIVCYSTNVSKGDIFEFTVVLKS